MSLNEDTEHPTNPAQIWLRQQTGYWTFQKAGTRRLQTQSGLIGLKHQPVDSELGLLYVEELNDCPNLFFEVVGDLRAGVTAAGGSRPKNKCKHPTGSAPRTGLYLCGISLISTFAGNRPSVVLYPLFRVLTADPEQTLVLARATFLSPMRPSQQQLNPWASYKDMLSIGVYRMLVENRVGVGLTWRTTSSFDAI